MIEREYGPCEIQIENRWIATDVLFADENDLPLLGMYTLEGGSFAIDTVNHKLADTP